LNEQDKPQVADPAAIRRDLEYMTARWGELSERVMFEIRAFKEGAQPQIAKFAPDWMDDAVDWAERMNGMGFNIYAVRNPIRHTVSGSASDTDIVAAFFLWADCDDPAAAGNVHRFDGPKWSAAVVTGQTPSTRVHTYWQLDKPITDLAKWRDMQATIARHFASDASVINPSRIMRVGGTVSYPNKQKQARGYIREITTIRTEYDEARPPVSLEQMARVFDGQQPARATPAPSPQNSTFQIDTGSKAATASEVTDLLSYIPADCGYSDWLAVLMGLHDKFNGSEEGLTLADQWSARGAKYVPGEVAAKWRSFDVGGGAGFGSIAELARQNGADLSQIARQHKGTAMPAVPKRETALEWFDDVKPALSSRYIIKGVLDQGAMSVVYGPSNSGKTFFALDMAFHVAIGARWRDLRVKQNAVLYLAAEGGSGVSNRIVALKEETGVCDVPFALRRAGLDLLHDQADLQHIADLANEVMRVKPGLPLVIVIDTLSRVMAGGDENSAADMTALIRNIDAIREATGAHICLVHHTGKDTARGARGHSSLRAATDTEIEVQNEDGARAAQVTKQRDHQGGETFAFNLKAVSLGHDEDGDEVTSCVVEAADSDEYKAAQKAQKGRGKNQHIIMETFDQMIAEGLGKGNPGGVGMPEPGQFWAVDAQELRTISQGKMIGDNAAKLFRTAWEGLTGNDGLFVTGNNLAWRIDRRKRN
jgi:hypothetical protein